MYWDLIAVGLCVAIWAGCVAVLMVRAHQILPEAMDLITEEKSDQVEEFFTNNYEFRVLCNHALFAGSILCGIAIGVVAERWEILAILYSIISFIHIGASNRKFPGPHAAIITLIFLLSAILGSGIRFIL